MREALETVGGRVPLLVEIKSRGDAGPLEERVAHEPARYAGPVAVTSFNPRSLAQMANLAPKVLRGQISGRLSGEGLPGWQVFALRHLLVCALSRPDFIVYELEALPSRSTSLQRWMGRRLVAYSPDTPEQAERALQVADGFIGNPGALPSPK